MRWWDKSRKLGERTIMASRGMKGAVMAGMG